MPVVFFGHGSPMNTLERNPYTEVLAAARQLDPRPKAILCDIGAWYNRGAPAVHGHGEA